MISSESTGMLSVWHAAVLYIPGIPERGGVIDTPFNKK